MLMFGGFLVLICCLPTASSHLPQHWFSESSRRHFPSPSCSSSLHRIACSRHRNPCHVALLTVGSSVLRHGTRSLHIRASHIVAEDLRFVSHNAQWGGTCSLPEPLPGHLEQAHTILNTTLNAGIDQDLPLTVTFISCLCSLNGLRWDSLFLRFIFYYRDLPHLGWSHIIWSICLNLW